MKESLEKEGFILKPRNLEEVYRISVETGKDKYISKLIDFMMNFIEQYKTAGYDTGGFEVLRRKTDNPRISFEKVPKQLFEADKKHEFSFISKMLHTINPTRTIYDSQVDATLCIHRSYQSDFSKRLQSDSDILAVLLPVSKVIKRPRNS